LAHRNKDKLTFYGLADRNKDKLKFYGSGSDRLLPEE
jgi:hypothetical protein